MKNLVTSLAVLCLTVFIFGCTRDVSNRTADETSTPPTVSGTQGGEMNPSTPSSDPSIGGPASGTTMGRTTIPGTTTDTTTESDRLPGATTDTGPGTTSGTTRSGDTSELTPGLGSSPIPPTENPEAEDRAPAE